MIDRWNVQKSSELYNITNWGGGYFSINSQGHVIVTPERNRSCQLDLYQLADSLIKRGIQPPMLIRFDGIIRDRVSHIQESFRRAISEANYKGQYHLAYPIKVNQQRHVVDSVRTAGKVSGGIGLEVGSKPELLAVLAIHDTPGGLLLCNGYKDTQYIELALLARKLGRRSIIIVEQFNEIDDILKVSKDLGIEPEIGVRMKPQSKGSGRWESSAGEGAKFGLFTYEIIQLIDTLSKHGKLDWLKLLHFHIGSQITTIAAIKRVLKEATRTYVELAKLCPSLSILDVGGGLGVDYDGSQTNFESSMNYTVDEYARDVVWEILSGCDEASVAHPDIVSESGRAVVAHHSVLIAQVIDSTPILDTSNELEKPPSDDETLNHIYTTYQDLTLKNCLESLHDAISLRDEVLLKFTQGNISLRERGYAERALKQLLSKIYIISGSLKYRPEELEGLEERLHDTFFCNFSLFQSVPDSWAIDHLFPIMPIHKLDQEPSRRAVIADLTCDSDGKIDRFIDLREVKNYVRLHPLNGGGPYLVGVFLVGAYQEILGDLHNLFGDTNAVHVDFGPDCELEVGAVVEGDTVREVLSYVQFEPQDLLDRLHLSIERALKSGALTAEESAKIQKRFREGLDEYTYLVS